jgi:TatD DNase family protein
VLHWYTGSLGLIDEAVEAGMYFSVNPAMLRSDKGRRTICAIPRSRVLTESDGPFAKMAGRVSSPVDIPWTVAELAKYWEMKPDDAKRLVHENMTRLYASTVGSSDPAAGT